MEVEGFRIVGGRMLVKEGGGFGLGSTWGGYKSINVS